MRHEPRLIVPGRPHLIYLRGNNRRLLFASRADRLMWTECVRRALDATQCQLHQMALMNNRVYSIITPPTEKALSDVVKRACERYAQRRNQLRGGSGRLFQVGFRSRAIMDDPALRDTTLYADAAALRAGKDTDPFVNEWSTAPVHAGLPGRSPLRSVWTPSTWYVRLRSTPQERHVAYRQAMVDFLLRGAESPFDAELEREDETPYQRRVERPNGSWAREAQLQYGRKAKGRRRLVG